MKFNAVESPCKKQKKAKDFICFYTSSRDQYSSHVSVFSEHMCPQCDMYISTPNDQVKYN